MLVFFAAVAPAPPDVEVEFTPIPPPRVAPLALEEVPDDLEVPVWPALPRRRVRDPQAVAAGVTFAAVTGVLAGAALSTRAPYAGGCGGFLIKCQ